MDSTLVSLIIVQVGIKVQVGKISKIDENVDWNFWNFVTMIYGFSLKISKFYVQVGIRVCRLENF